MTPATHAAAYLPGEAAADAALARITAGTSDPELLLRALCRVLAESGYPIASPPPALAGFCRRWQKHVEVRT